jgi:hypothetical protein
MNLVPRIQWPDRNTKRMLVTLPDVYDLYFSYGTLIGAVVVGVGTYAIQHRWGPTTRRHYKEFGLDRSYVQTVSEEHLAELVNECMVVHFQETLRARFINE